MVREGLSQEVTDELSLEGGGRGRAEGIASAKVLGREGACMLEGLAAAQRSREAGRS